ncbi:hypothetical protein [Phaeobacter sp. B1627]|uniref:hypothetical protein n=1 Tax=Phaeobacter sp. B1627 TaxID=2583809 RepID=UPI001119E7C7|nr:hypothetical protein [Phaeobacter sp. B1627]TNJ40979.1 hypothetical protein FGE21_15885 [Phaeobacter sp. B1627]
MEFLFIFTAMYVPTVLLALLLTHWEQKENPEETSELRLLGLLLCAVWPLVGLVMVGMRQMSTVLIWRASRGGQKT